MPIHNNVGGIPKSIVGDERRSTIFTATGVERVHQYTDSAGVSRKKSERLNKIKNVLTSAGTAKPSYIEFEKNRSVINQPVNVLVSFNQAINVTGSSTLAIANTAGGAAGTATASNAVSYAGNTLTFIFTPTVAGTYTIRGQTIGGGSTITTKGSNTAVTKAFANNDVNSILVVTAS